MDREELEKKLNSIDRPEVKMEEHQKQLKARLINVRKTAIFGSMVGIFIIGIFSGSFYNLIDPLSLVLVVPVSLLLIIATYGMEGAKIVFTAPLNLNVKGEKKILYKNVIRDLKLYLIIMGATGTLMGWIILGANTEYLEMLPRAISVSLITTFYGLILAFCYCYPIQRRIENNPD